jgi:flagellar biosynthesis protein FlhB
MSEDQEKTEAPTPERLRQAREDGNIARSKDAGAVAASASALLAVAALGPEAFLDYLAYSENSFRSLEQVDGGVLGQLFKQTLGMIAMTTIPLAGAAAMGSVLINLAEVGIQLNWSLIEPKWSRLNPMGKLTKLFSPKSAGVATVLTLTRVAVIGWITTDIIESELPTLARLPRVPIDAALLSILAIVGRIAFWSTLALAVLSAADYGQSWWQRMQDLKMSRQELKDEMHQQEGNQKMKWRRMQRAREIVRSGLHKEIQRADVVVTDPTHVAVVLRYHPEEGAPVVSAKGLEETALVIKEIAKEYGVPVVESKTLARALYAQVKIGRQIPVDLFQVVAELLAYVYRLKRKKRTA